MDIFITKIRPSRSGEEVELHIMVQEHEHKDEEVFIVAPDFYASLGLPLYIDTQISIDKDTYERLEYGNGLTYAIKKGLNLLAYSQNTGKTLYQKLLRRGCPSNFATEAVAYLKDHGFINENRQAEMLAEDLATKHHYGPRRIKQELYAKGFSNEMIADILENLSVDYADYCALRIRKAGGLAALSDRAKKDKLVAALQRYGYSFEQIRSAIRLIERSKND